jgi:hypothetical protein
LHGAGWSGKLSFTYVDSRRSHATIGGTISAATSFEDTFNKPQNYQPSKTPRKNSQNMIPATKADWYIGQL